MGGRRQRTQAGGRLDLGERRRVSHRRGRRLSRDVGAEWAEGHKTGRKHEHESGTTVECGVGGW